MPKIKINDVNIYYEIHGEGFPIVMIMGLSANIDWWDPLLINKMSDKYRTIIFDNRGAGRSDKPKTEYSIKLFADDTAGLMDALEIQKAYILGVSMGGMIAQEFAVDYPERVEKLILCATNCGLSKSVQPSPEVMSILTRSTEELTAEEVARDTIQLLYTQEFIDNNTEIIEQTIKQILKAPIPAHAYKRQIEAILKFDVCRKIKKINIPTLILHGKKDILVPPQNAEILANRIPGAKLMYLEDSGHGIFTPEFDKFTQIVLEFLES